MSDFEDIFDRQSSQVHALLDKGSGIKFHHMARKFRNITTTVGFRLIMIEMQNRNRSIMDTIDDHSI